MLQKNIIFKSVFVISLLIVFLSLIKPNEASSFSNRIIQRGATGSDVIELQSRLKHVGFFTGKIDGVFGWKTYWALRNFQYEFGLPIDGVAGSATKNKLVKATKNYKPATAGAKNPTKATSTNTPNGFSQNDIKLMANAVHGEARGEPYVGQVAVAAVILNRVNSQSFPNTVSGVIFEPGAFTAVADGQIWLTPNATSKKAVQDALNGWDPTGEAIYYFNPATATSKWIWGRPQIKKIGKHIFCK
ncbi:spore cortex-lytic enzyme [Neobacillus sp. LXY-4]|uniref:spore cortex-lytic enzyme n=1 Tax=Neobacillus sp. LXY-4 TaxID=3379826 RepID=UPI003EE349E0